MFSRTVDAIDAGLIREMLAIPSFEVPFRDVVRDSERAADKIDEALTRRGLAENILAVDVIRGGFFRNRGAYVVGRICLNGGLVVPLILAPMMRLVSMSTPYSPTSPRHITFKQGSRFCG